MFQLQSSYKPAGDQPKAIEELLNGFGSGAKALTLMGATGTGKTFTMANIIQSLQKPTLIISHNKTLAAQLATEFKYFFPNNAVHYFVSYFDYYQPESYLPEKGLYIEKEATINQEIEMYRLATMASLLSREDVIVVASVSSLYGLGSKRFFKENCLQLEVGQKYSFDEIKAKLLSMQYKPVQSKIEAGMFEFKGEVVDIFASTEKNLLRLHFSEDDLEIIEIRDSISFNYKGKIQKITIRPATQFMQDISDLDNVLNLLQKEMEDRVQFFKKSGKLVEAERIQKRVLYDIRMIKETGFVNGIENYSPYFEKRLDGQPPNTLFDYFPDDFLLIVDESHMTLPQFQAMPQADASRKRNLVEHGFRLPSATNHRPLSFQEMEHVLGWYDKQKNLSDEKMKYGSKTLFTSATPANYELNLSDHIVEQIIRPTGLLDPITYVYPKSGDYEMLLNSVDILLKKKPHLKHFFQGYKHKEKDFEEIFGGK